MILASLFKRTSTGAVQSWQIEIENNKFRTIEGQIDGVKTTSEWTICSGKNIGRANETTAVNQAIIEATSKLKKKLDSGYVESIDDIDITRETFEPMLAKKYVDRKATVKFPVFTQAKLDGCLSGDTIVNLKNNGNKTLKEIYDDNIDDEILSYNIKTKKKEYKKIVGRFKNGIDIQHEKEYNWYLIELENGQTLKLTGNHLIYLPDLKCWRRVDELTGTENVLLK